LHTDLGKISASPEVFQQTNMVFAAGARGRSPGQGKKRLAARGKIEMVLRLLLRQDLELLSRQLGVNAG